MISDTIHPFNPLKILCHFMPFWCDYARHKTFEDNIPFPVVLNLDLTNKCNQNCKWCYVKEMRKKNNIDMCRKDVCKILDEFYGIGTRAILFTGGGEPTLHPDFCMFVKRANDLGFRIGLTTNGTKLKNITDCLKDTNLRYVRISIDAGYSGTYAKVHGCDYVSYEEILENARRFSEVKKRDCALGFAFLVTQDNYKETKVAIERAEINGFDYISFRPSVFGHTLTDEQIRKTISDIKEKKEISRIKVYPINKRFIGINKKYPCRSTPLVAVVTADTRLNLCCQYRGREEWQWGDLGKYCFTDLWGNDEHRELLKKALSIDCLLKCPKCRMTPYNEIIERIFIDDEMHIGFV